MASNKRDPSNVGGPSRGGFLGAGAALGLGLGSAGGLLATHQPAVAASGRKIDQLRFLFIVKTVNSDYWQTCLKGGQQAQQQLGLQGLQFTGANSEANIQGQIALVEDALAKKPDFLVLAPTSATALDASIDKVYKAGIKVILIDSSANTDSYQSFLATDNHAGGVLAAKTLAAAIKKKTGAAKGQVAYSTFLSGVGSLTARDKGFTDGLKDYPDLQLVAHKDAGGDQSTKPIGIVADTLTRFPNLVGFFADNLYTLQGAATAFRENKVNKAKVSLVGFDPSPELVTAIKAGNVDGIILQDPYQMGYGGVSVRRRLGGGCQHAEVLEHGRHGCDASNVNSAGIKALLSPDTQRDLGFRG